jgi:hypothetical protein
MTEAELSRFLQRKILAAMNEEDGDVSDIRQDSLDYYVGKEYGNERDGFSQVVTRETMEVVEWAKPSIMRALWRDKPATFDPVGQQDEQQAAQETDVVTHVLKKRNNGFLELYQWVNDILMYPNGYVKVWCEKSEREEEATYIGQTLEQIAILENNPDVEILAATETGRGVWNVHIKEQRHITDYLFRAVPPEHVLVDEDLSSIDLDRASMVTHRYKSTWTDLVEQGVDPDLLAKVGSDDSYRWQDETVNRKFHEDENPDNADEDDDSMREYWVHECWGRWDEEGDGLAKRRKAVMIGQTIIPPSEDEYGEDYEGGGLSLEVDYQPFIAASAIVMSHKHIGMSYFECMRDLQLIRSVIKRHILNNAYRHNVPKKYVGERFLLDDGSTEDGLEDAESEYVYADDPAAINYEQEPANIISDLLAVDQSLRDDIQQRTGVAPNISLDPAVLQQATMGAYMGAMEQASQRIELLVRLIAEIGMVPLMRKTRQLLRMYQDVELNIKVSDDWVTVNPQAWREREDMTVAVGLGHRGPTEKLQFYDMLLQKQERALSIGMAKPIHIYNTLEKQVDLADLGNVEEFFLKPDPNMEMPQQPNPQDALIQANMQVEQMKLQAKAQGEAEERQMKQQQWMVEARMKAEKEARDHEARMREVAVKELEAMAKIENMDVDSLLKLQQARELDITNDAAESGVDELLNEFEAAVTQTAAIGGG